MSKYYREEDVIRAIAEQLCWEAQTEYGDKFTTEDWLEEAEDYVSDLPTVEVSEDCISREWVKGICEMMLDEEMLEHMLGYIEDAPSATTEQSSKVGEWTNAGILTVQCSNCKSQFHELEAMNYCPNCGAKMRGSENE